MPRSTSTLQSAGAEPAGAPADAANALPSGHRLHEFELRGVIGVGGFGIVYRAFDHSLEREVAIKEYMPSALAGRSSKQQVSLLSASHSETFALGLSSFVNEARLLARFDHPSLVKVHRFWEQNGTAYMVMPLYRGSTLRRLRQQRDVSPGGAWLMRLTERLLGALEVLHREGVYHRDIAPDNVLVSDDAPPVLLDFGAARRVISDRNQALTAILKPSYAPLEQYAESTGMRQGPWTDFYALGATLHYVITGKAPVPATARAVSDEQPRLAGSGQGGVPDLLLQVCDWMLAPAPQDRPQNVAELLAALAGQLPVPQRARRASASSWQNTVAQMDEGELGASVFAPSELPVPRAQAERRARARPIWGAAAAMVIVAAGGAWWASAGSTPQAAPEPLASARAAPAADSARHPSMAVADPANAGVREQAKEPAAPIKPNTVQAAAPAAAATAKPRAPSAAPTRGQATASTKPKTTPPRGPDGNTATRPAASHAAPPAGAMVPMAAAANDAASGQAPVSVATATHNPRERCGRRHLLAMHRCLVRECEKPEYTAHRECQRVRDIEAQARALHGSN
ncbi:MAG TPA: serine/threonine-protein kinase [Burkholderiaceae bacterium]|nr:serine/threonine-protein kinase [Burkholderiaceae bacterium]